MSGGHLWQSAITPVYVQAGSEPGLLNVLVTGYTVDDPAAGRLKEATGGSEFVFLSGGQVVASTMSAIADSQIRTQRAASDPARVEAGGVEYTMLGTTLPDVLGNA